MTDTTLLLPVIMPFAAALLVLFVPKTIRMVREGMVLGASLMNLVLAAAFFKTNASISLPWLGFGFDLALRFYHFGNFIVLASAVFILLTALYCSVFLYGKSYSKQFYFYFLLSVGLTNGAVLADNLLLVLFFWEAMLLPLFGMIAIGNRQAYKTATKAFIIVGATDLCFMAGIILSGSLAATFTISRINLPPSGLGALAFLFLMVGIISKAGAMPFHSWIPDAAIDAPLPFMAFFPASLEKLLGIYFLARISLDMFKVNGDSWVSLLLMVVGALTILLAVAMALIQTDYKRLLSYHAISQVGYMILGIGTLVPAGIIGGLFHMLNHTVYKSCLFFSAGSLERQAGTTALEKLGGLAGRMPVTFACFLVAALSISGVPPFNGFFSKELVYEGALQRGWVFYLAALLGSFLTAVSFLKLGHAAFLGRTRENNRLTAESPFSMLIPMVVLALVCITFGVFNFIPLRYFIQPVVGFGGPHQGVPSGMFLGGFTVAVLALALLNHVLGVKSGGSALKATDHIHYAPALKGIYEKAEKGYLDPYNIGWRAAGVLSAVSWRLDRAVDWFYDSFCVKAASGASAMIRRMHSGNYSVYIGWSLAASAAVITFLLKIHG